MGPGMRFSARRSGPYDPVARVRLAESLGYDSAWTAEAYATDAIVPLTWLAAHTSKIRLGTSVVPMAARSPAMTAMTAATLDQLSDGRLLLGLGVSTPQLVEGWHNQVYGRPLDRTREYVSIVRHLLQGQGPLEHSGPYYQMPYSGEGATGLGRPPQLPARARRRHIPVYLAALGPGNVKLAFEIADGWLPMFFSPQRSEVWEGHLEKAKPGFDIAPT